MVSGLWYLDLNSLTATQFGFGAGLGEDVICWLSSVLSKE